MTAVEIGIIGGSGLYNMDVFVPTREVQMKTPFGAPSAALVVGKIEGKEVAFLPRHGRGHILSPSEVPYQANIFAMKKLGVRYIIAVSACGSLRKAFAPGHIVVPDQLVDFTKGKRAYSFFGQGLVAHVGVANPFSPRLSDALISAVKRAGGITHQGGTYITIEGPRFSTRGESNLFRQWGMDIVGMTTSPEATLAAEAEIAYAVMAHVTDYDVWHESEESVTVDMVVKTLAANTELAQLSLRNLIADQENWDGDFPVHHGMKDALSLIGDWGAIPDQVKGDLEPIIGKYLSD